MQKKVILVYKYCLIKTVLDLFPTIAKQEFYIFYICFVIIFCSTLAVIVKQFNKNKKNHEIYSLFIFTFV